MDIRETVASLVRLLAHPARPWHLDGDRSKDNVSKYVRFARLHEVAQGKASGADLRLAREAPCHLAGAF
jgi:hypothetical protein